MDKHAFVDATTKRLKGCGFTDRNQPGDLIVPVPWDFNLDPDEGYVLDDAGLWQLVGPIQKAKRLDVNDLLGFLVSKGVLSQKDVDDAKAAK